MEQGRIIKNISNHYDVALENQTVTAIPRGKMRRNQAPVVGDIVQVEQVQDSWRIHSIQPRANRLLRPAVANVDQALIVTSCKDPDFSIHLLNRLIFLVCLSSVRPVICITKADLLSKEEKQSLEAQMDWYEKAGYAVVWSCPGSDDTKLREVLNGKVSVLCGQSGAGKSSLLNRLDPSFSLATQQISRALGRGKHTTRHCELHPVAGGLVADTPGFSSLDFEQLDIRHLDQQIPDFKPYLGQCRFSDCRHIHEPDCAVKQALEDGKLNPEIYADYKEIMEGQKHA